MLPNDIQSVDRLVKFSVAGAFCGMAAAGWILWLDISAIGSLLSASDNSLQANLFLGGGMLKGGVLGLALGLAALGKRRDASRGAISPQTPATAQSVAG